MSVLATQRCLHHASREAVARCPECAHFFCRECITEHDDRVICAPCLKKIADRATRKTRRRLALWPVVQLGVGFLGAWLVFHTVGRMLLALPSEFHESSLWDSRFFDAVESGSHE